MAAELRNEKPVVAVTGAAGLVGGHLIEYLIGKGYPVIGVARKSSNVDFLGDCIACDGDLTAKPEPGRVVLRRSDLLDADGMKVALAGAEIVVHAAGTVDPYGSREAIFATNSGGTKNTLEAARAIGAKQFIFVSSLSVITGQGDQYNLDESAPRRRCGESYADSKVEAEETVMGEAHKPGMFVTAVRPGFIYGPRERSWMPRVINSVATGKAMLIDGGSKETNVIFVDNLSRAIEACFRNEKAYGEVFNLTDGQKTTKKQLFDAIADGLSLPRVKKNVPGSVAKVACEVVSSIAPYLPEKSQRNLSRFSRAAFRLAGVNQGFNISKAERQLGYVDRVSFADGMRITLSHFKKDRESQTTSSRANAGHARV